VGGKRYVAVMPRQLLALLWVFLGLSALSLIFWPVALVSLPIGLLLLLPALIHHAAVVARATRLNRKAR
jgi:hypothetical protein